MPALKTREQDLQAALEVKNNRLSELSQSWTIEDNGGVVITQDQKADFEKTLGEAEEIKGLLEMERKANGFRSFMGGTDDASAATRLEAQRKSADHEQSNFPMTVGEMFTESEEFKDLIRSGGTKMNSPFTLEGVDLGSMWTFGRTRKSVMGSSGRKDVYTTMPTGPSLAPRFGQVQMDPMIPLRQRTARVRDLFPVQTTSANLIEFFRVSGFTNNASVVPERSGGAFGLKPQSSLAFTVAQAPVRTVAHWEVAHRNVLADAPQLQGIVNNELLYGLRLHEDYQILQGTGTGEDLLGVLNTPGIQSRARTDVANDTNTDALRRAITLVNLAYYEATGVVLHPNNWETMELSKETTGGYILAVNVAIGAEQRVWRLPVVDTPAMPANTGLVAAFGLGWQLYDREQGTIRTTDSHSDFFLRNAIVILAEERLALAGKVPESACKVTSLN